MPVVQVTSECVTMLFENNGEFGSKGRNIIEQKNIHMDLKNDSCAGRLQARVKQENSDEFEIQK